eukprot:gene31372-6531_t
MLSNVARSVLRIAQPMGTRAMSGLKGFNEAEAAKEAIYFNKEDQRIMMKLLNKVKAQSDVADKHGAIGVEAAERSAISDITSALMKWKHTHY